VGPMSYLRPGTELAEKAKAGTFVEIKNSQVGPGSKVPHLSYIGDASIGASVNVGAGSITCNYDGWEKHGTVIEDGSFVGSDTMFVAPVRIGKGAVVGAGSVITSDVPEDSLAVARGSQETYMGWAARRRARHRAEREDDG
jgi:bifunctional UDP-N-acetylglucosamine pyrophosphorylase/glucosamine-1-phosphate N-acetyltransferase